MNGFLLSVLNFDLIHSLAHYRCQLGQEDEPAAEDDEEDSMETESGPPTTTMKSFKDAIVALEDTQNFLEGRGHLAASLTYIGLAVDAVAALSWPE